MYGLIATLIATRFTLLFGLRSLGATLCRCLWCLRSDASAV